MSAWRMSWPADWLRTVQMASWGLLPRDDDVVVLIEADDVEASCVVFFAGFLGGFWVGGHVGFEGEVGFLGVFVEVVVGDDVGDG